MKKLFPIFLLFVISCRKNPSDLNVAPPPINFLISSDSVVLNPSGYTPLSALVNFTSPVIGKTYIEVVGKHGKETDVTQLFDDMGLHHKVAITGLYSNYLNTVGLFILNNSGDTLAKSTLKIKTDTLPSGLPTSIIADLIPGEKVEKGLNLVSSYTNIDPYIPYMTDNYGEIRWVLNYKSHPTLNKLFYEDGIKILRNGNFYFGDVSTKKIYEIDAFGNILHSWDLSQTEYSFHHDIDEKPDGNFIVSVTKSSSKRLDNTSTIEDYIIEIDRASGNIKTVWDLKESLDENRFVLITNKNDWIHVNAVIYDSTDNTIIVSGRTQGVVKLTFDNKIKWILGNHKGWTTNRRGEDLNKYLLTPLTTTGKPITDTSILNGYTNDPDFEWNWYQHSTIKIPDGNLMIFDNGATRNYNDLAPKYSRAVEFKIDPVNMTVQQVWQFGKEQGLNTFSSIVSSVQFLPNTNHVLFSPGYQVINTSGKGGKVLEIDYNTKKIISESSFSSTNGWGFHRAKRIYPYPH